MLRFFESRIPAFPDAPPERPPEGLVAFLWHYSKDALPWLLTMSALTAVISILEVSLFGFLGNLIDWLGDRDPETFLDDEGGKLALMGLVILVLLPLAGFLQSVIQHQTVLPNYTMRVRWQAHRWMLGQSHAFFQDEFAGRVATKVMQTTLAIRDAVLKVLDVLVYVGVYFVGAMLLMGSASGWLMLPFVLWLVAYVAMLRHFLPRLKAVSRRQADARSEMTGRVVDSYTNMATVKLFAHTGHEGRYAKDSMEVFLDTVYPQMRLVTGMNVVLDGLNALLLFSVGAIGIALWMQGVTAVGPLAVGVGLVLRLQGMSNWIMWELSGLFESIGIIYDGKAMLSKPREVLDAPGASDLAVPEGRIEFEGVSFHYGKETGVIDDLSVVVRGGEKIGLVGRSGAGKTTLTNLLLRLYDVESGRVLIDGTDVREIRQESLRRHVGVVTQDTSLLHRSVFDNIAYGRKGASEADVVAAATRARAHDFILDLEDSNGRRGYAAHVGERGVKLSGGQRQRIAIARMFLKDAPILVLDEATSALDSEVEAVIQENLAALMDGKTVIAIAHRLSTIAAMDRLLVMDAGRIVEEGDHATLAAGDGLYAQLWSRQSGGFTGAGAAPSAGDGKGDGTDDGAGRLESA